MVSDARAIRRRAPTLFGTVLALFGACTILEYASPSLRYLKYATPIATLLVIASSPRARPVSPNDRTREYFVAMLRVAVAAVLVSLIVTLFQQRATNRFAEEVYFVCGPVLVAYLIFPSLEKQRVPQYAKYLFLTFVAAYVVENGLEIVESARDPANLLVQMVTSTLASESTASFAFGLFCLYFVFEKQRSWAWAVGSFALTVLSFKRVAILGTIVAFLAYQVMRLIRLDPHRGRRWIPIVMLAFNAMILFVIWKVAQGAFDDIVVDYTGLSTNWLTMGRAEAHRVVLDELGFSWFGSGLGSITALFESHRMSILNAHSDVLKYAIEVGPIVSSVWIYTFYRLHCRSRELLAVALYLNILFITDNVSIYFTFLFTFYLLTGFLGASSENHHQCVHRDQPT